MSGIPYAGTSRGLVRFSCDKCNYKVFHWYAFAVSWKSIYLNTSNLAEKTRYSIAFSVKFSIKAERFLPYRGWLFVSDIYLFLYKFIFIWRVPPWWSRGELTSRIALVYISLLEEESILEQIRWFGYIGISYTFICGYRYLCRYRFICLCISILVCSF